MKSKVLQEIIEAVLKDPKAYEAIRGSLLKLSNGDQKQLIKILDTKNLPKLATTPVQ